MAPSTTNYREIQQDEIEALHSIYMEDFVEEEMKTGAWNKTLDRTFKINLKATIRNEDRTALTLTVSFPPTYPKSPPKLKLSFDEYLRQKTRAQAEYIVNQKPKSLLGSEMIFEIATSLQEVLDSISQANAGEVPTLEEERIAHERAAVAEVQQIQEERRLQDLQAANEKTTDNENQLLLELVEREKNRTATRKAKLMNRSSQLITTQSIPRGLAFEQPSRSIRGSNGNISIVNAVHQKTYYRRGPVSTVTTVQPWQDPEENDLEGTSATGSEAPFLVLKESTIVIEEDIRGLIQRLEATLDLHTRLALHPSVMSPLNFRIQRTNMQGQSGLSEHKTLVDNASNNSSHGTWTVSILMQLSPQGSLMELMDTVDCLDIKKVRAWSIQIVEGLHHYHRHGAAHGVLHLNNILLERDEAKSTLAKLSDGGYQRELHLLASHENTIWPSGWNAPELVADTRAEVLPSTDIWHFGVCFLQIAFGSDTVNQYQSPAALQNDLRLSESLSALLSQVFYSDPKKRPSAWDLLHYEFFRNDDALLAETSSSLYDEHHIERTGPSSLLRNRRDSALGPISSRYSKEFVEDGKLGRGGFGEVFRARNKVDGQLYAIKKVKAKSKAALDPVLSEATVLSRLNHPNVVRYFASWIDDDVGGESGTDVRSSVDDSSDLSFMSPGPVLAASSRGLDFISSNHADIVFANDEGAVATSSDDSEIDGQSDEESDDEESDSSGGMWQKKTVNRRFDESSKATLDHPGRSETNWTILYIQMEYCKQETLRDLINTGIQANANECWRLFRQIVQGLAHIHSASIVHRDLKPENIFIDKNGDVRIGDFGLARPGDYRIPIAKGRIKEAFGSFTKDIGTASYVAPEVRSGGSGKYDEKADMYSLGVMLLELNVVFTTGMERAETLDVLYKEDHKFPSALETPDKTTQSAIVHALIQHKPSLRPSSSELLSSGRIPAQDEDETFRIARQLLSEPNSRFRSHFISSMFSQQQSSSNLEVVSNSSPSGLAQRIEFLEDVAAMSRSLPELELQSMVKQTLTSIFHRHGAVERTDSPALFPYHSSYPASDVVQLLHPTGKVFQLPYDLILPNALLLARRVCSEPKTFVFDNVYRVLPFKDQPNIYGEANFDIVTGDGPTNLALAEAEAIKVVDEIVDAFPNLRSAHICYHLNHSQLLDAILTFCDIDRSKWAIVKETMSKLNIADWTWTRVRHELRSPPISVAGTCLDDLEQFDFRETIDKTFSRLRLLLKDATALESIFRHMKSVTKYLDRFNVKRKIYVSPLSSYNEKFYSGNLLFQCLHDQKKRAVFAAGGRYDQLIRDHQPLSSARNQIHAVGFQLTWSGLCTGMMTYLKAQAKSKIKRKNQADYQAWIPRRCDVLIDSFDPDLLGSIGIEIVNELWANNISAELADEGVPTSSGNSYTKNAPSNIRESHSWVILIKSEDFVKIKSNSRQDETEIRTSELASHIANEIRDRERTEGRVPKAPLPRQTSHQDNHAPAHDREVEVKIVTSERKSKKVNRKAIVEEATAQAQEWRTAALDNPIIAIETKEETFEAIKDTRMGDAESWKRLIQWAPATERQYLGLVQTLLEEQSGSGGSFVYNFRTKAMMYYQLGKRG